MKDELKKADPEKVELSLDDLDAVAGGKVNTGNIQIDMSPFPAKGYCPQCKRYSKQYEYSGSHICYNCKYEWDN